MDAADIAKAIAEGFDEAVAAGAFDADVDAFAATEVVPVWEAHSPEDSGEYKASIAVTPASRGTGKVGATVDYANIVEYGSIDTPAFAPRARTVEHFNEAPR